MPDDPDRKDGGNRPETDPKWQCGHKMILVFSFVVVFILKIQALERT